jgi:hypothetical protein
MRRREVLINSCLRPFGSVLCFYLRVPRAARSPYRRRIAKFLLEFLNPKPADNFRLNEASRTEMLRSQVKKGDGWEGLAWALEQHDGTPMLFTHAGSDAGWYCITAGSAEQRSGLMVMLNGDTYVPFLMKMLANPSRPPSPPESIWPDFAKRFFAG